MLKFVIYVHADLAPILNHESMFQFQFQRDKKQFDFRICWIRIFRLKRTSSTQNNKHSMNKIETHRARLDKHRPIQWKHDDVM